MKSLAACTAFLFFNAAAAAPPTCEAEYSTDRTVAGACRMPADVQALVMRQEACIHFADEEPYDAERRRELEQAIRESCGNEKRAAILMRRYGNDTAIATWLRAYARETGLTDGHE